MLLGKFSVLCVERDVHGQAVCEINEVSMDHDITLWFDK